MCQDKDESEPDNESFLVLYDASNEQSRPLVITLIIGSFVIFLFQNIHERTKNLVFVLVDEQAISAKLDPM